jgi:hypothetical protein
MLTPKSQNKTYNIKSLRILIISTHISHLSFFVLKNLAGNNLRLINLFI